MTSTPYLVSGTLINSSGDKVSDGFIQFTISGESETVSSNVKGKYTIDLANIGYNPGNTVSYSAKDKSNNEIYSGSFVGSGETKTLNISLSERKDRISGTGNRDINLTNIGGESVSWNNPLPIAQVSIPMYLGKYSLSYTGSNLTKVVKTIGDNTYTLTLGYTGSNLTSVSEWVKA